PLDLFTLCVIATTQTHHERRNANPHHNDEQKAEDQPRSVEERNEAGDGVGVRTWTVQRVGVVVSLQRETDRPQHREYDGSPGEGAPSRRGQVPVGEEEEGE